VPAEGRQPRPGPFAEAYEALPTRWGRAILVGGVLALVGAVLWDAVSCFGRNALFWLLAIAIGGVIGWGTTKAAGKGGRGVQFLAGAFTLVVRGRARWWPCTPSGRWASSLLRAANGTPPCFGAAYAGGDGPGSWGDSGLHGRRRVARRLGRRRRGGQADVSR
jgi:hypothetical protein